MDSLSGEETPVRVRLTKGNQVVNALPSAAVAVMYGLWDHADGYGFQPDSAFYVSGTFALDLPAGQYQMVLTKGLEYLDQSHTIRIEAGQTFRQTCRMARWINMPAQGWYSADDHIHIRRSPREDSLLLDWIRAEDVHVGVLLRMGDFWETYYPQYAWGEKGIYQRGIHLLTSGQEDPRTPELGHALGLGASDKVRFPKEYYFYDKVFDQLHELGGLTGYAHQAETFHGYRGLTLDGLRGKVDVLELLQFCAAAEPLQTDHYYHLLDLGYPVTAVAGSDFPWCGKDHDHGPVERTAHIGNARFYSYLGGPLSYTRWKDALRAGHTFVTSGPILAFTVNQHFPGDRLNVRKGTTLSIRAEAYGHATQVQLQRLEIVGHGKVLASVQANDKEPSRNRTQSSANLSLELKLPVNGGIWLAARTYAGPGQAAHTTPIYVSVDGSGFSNPATMADYLQLSELYLQELEHAMEHATQEPEQQVWRYREGLQIRITEVRKIIAVLKKSGHK